MKAYKGFRKTADGRIMCRNMEYKVGRIYRFNENDIELCKIGFHACHELHQVWFFYPNDGQKVFYEVECNGKIIESEDGSGKFVCSEITLVKEVDISHVHLFDDAWCFLYGFAVVKLDGKQNFIDTEGKLLSNQWFDDVSYFSEGFARVKLDGKWNFISTEGELLSEQWFDYASYFSEGFARVVLDGEAKKINKKGEIV